MKEKSIPQKYIPKKKVSLELLHQRLGHRSTRSILAGYTEVFWQEIQLRVYPEPFCTPYQIFTINKNYISKKPLNLKIPSKWAFMDIVPAIYSKSLTKDTTFSKYILIVNAYHKIPKLYEMENITTEESVDKIYIFQTIFGKVYGFGWWDMEIIQTDAFTQFIRKKFQGGLYLCGVKLELVAQYHQEINDQVEVAWRTLRTTAHSIILHARVSDNYIYILLMYTTDYISTVLPVKHLVN